MKKLIALLIIVFVLSIGIATYRNDYTRIENTIDYQHTVKIFGITLKSEIIKDVY